MAVAAQALDLRPFSLDHFRLWAADLVLDNGLRFETELFQELFLDDVFATDPLGLPLYTEIWLVVPEENGKTTLISGLALYHAEHRPMASVLVAASSREQGELVYRQGEGFVYRSPALHRMEHSPLKEAKGKRTTLVPRFDCLEGYRRINHHNGGRIQVFAADDRTGDGQLPTLGITEELHRHRDLSLYRTWSGKLGKRDGQLVAISTAGEPGSDFELAREQIRQTATRIDRLPTGGTRYVSGTVVLHEYAVPEDSDVTDMAVVKRANPFSRITEASLAAKFARPTMTLAHWRRFVCNLPTRGDNAAVTEQEWSDAKVDEVIPEGQHVDVGLDVAWKMDTTSAVPLWVRDSEHRLLGPATVLVPPRDGSMLHPDRVKDALREIHDRNPIDTLVMDVHSAADIAAWASDELGCTVVDRAQHNPDHAADFEAFMQALRNGWLKHTGDAGLTRHVLNASLRLLPGGASRFDRPMQSRTADQERRVIDALTAAAMVHRWATEELDQEEDVEPWVLVR